MLDIQHIKHYRLGGFTMILGDLIKRYRSETGTSMEQFAKKSGISKAYVSILERNYNPVNGKPVVPSLETIKAVSNAIGMDFNDVIATLDSNQPVAIREDKPPIPAGFEPLPEMATIPLVGSIACGTPILAEQNIEARIGVPALWRADFALTCHGNSMAAMIQDGDIVCIRKQPEVENGEIAAVRIGEEATLKRFYRQGDTVMLQAENPAFSPLVYTRDQLNEITIEGLVVGICRGI